MQLVAVLADAIVDDDDEMSGLGMSLSAVQNDETAIFPQSEKTSVVMMHISHGADFISQFGLKRRKVKGDGSCWVYAVLECAGLLDHGHPRIEQTPTQLDRAKDMHCRMMAVAWLRQHGQASLNLSDEEMGTVFSFLKTPEYPFDDDEDYGTFGNTTSIAGLIPYIKRTIILWDKTTQRNPMARQQVIEYSVSSTVRERVWDIDQIVSYCQNHEAIHIEWNGVNHYAALVGSNPVSIDDRFKAQLLELGPVTRIKQPSRIGSTQSDDGWCLFENAYRLEAEKRVRSDFCVDTPIDILKAQCIQAKCNAIQIHDEWVTFVRFDFHVTAADCRTAGDFLSRLYVLNKKSRKRKAAPDLFADKCLCRIKFKANKRLVQCDKCHRNCHQQCTHLAGMSMEEMLEIDEFVCGACVE